MSSVCLIDADGNHVEQLLQWPKSGGTCIHPCCRYVLSITTLIQLFFPLLSCVYVFGTLCVQQLITLYPQTCSVICQLHHNKTGEVNK